MNVHFSHILIEKDKRTDKIGLLALPDEVLLHILSFLTPQELVGSISRVNRKLYRLCSDDNLWEIMFWNYFVLYQSEQPFEAKVSSWKERFRLAEAYPHWNFSSENSPNLLGIYDNRKLFIDYKEDLIPHPISIGYRRGRHYFEVLLDPGDCDIGSAFNVRSAVFFVGFCSERFLFEDSSTFPSNSSSITITISGASVPRKNISLKGTDGFAYSSGGVLWHRKKAIQLGLKGFRASDTIGMLLDCDKRFVAFYHNRELQKVVSFAGRKEVGKFLFPVCASAFVQRPSQETFSSFSVMYIRSLPSELPVMPNPHTLLFRTSNKSIFLHAFSN